MPNTFPTAKNNFVTGASSGLLGTVGHAASHNALETKVGIDSSADTSSLDYKVTHRLPLEGGTMTGPLVIQPSTDVANLFIIKDNAGNQLFEVDTLNDWVKIGPDQANFNLDPNIGLYISRSQNSYSGMNVVNPNTGTLASTDMVVLNNTNDAVLGWIDMGISSTNFADPLYPILAGGKGYVYTISDDIFIGAAGSGKSLNIFIGGFEVANKIAKFDVNGLTLGVTGTTAGKLNIAGGTTGTATIVTETAAGTPTITLPTSTCTLIGTSSTDTLTNKRITPRVSTVTSSATVTPTSDNCDMYTVTAQAEAVTIEQPSGTPTNGQKLVLRLLDNGTAYGITWHTGSAGDYRFSTDLPAPSTTVLSKTMYLGFIYNSAASRWDNVAQLGNL